MPDYARYFRQDLLSDCNLIISWPAASGSGDDPAATAETPTCTTADESNNEEAPNACQSVSLPAHQIVLFNSKHFEAQVCRTAEPNCMCMVRMPNGLVATQLYNSSTVSEAAFKARYDQSIASIWCTSIVLHLTASCVVSDDHTSPDLGAGPALAETIQQQLN